MGDLNQRQNIIDRYYKKNGPCCAGCDWWRWFNTIVGECHRHAPVSAKERYSMLGIKYASPANRFEAGHILTKRDHVCGDFIDTHKWS